MIIDDHSAIAPSQRERRELFEPVRNRRAVDDERRDRLLDGIVQQIDWIMARLTAHDPEALAAEIGPPIREAITAAVAPLQAQIAE